MMRVGLGILCGKGVRLSSRRVTYREVGRDGREDYDLVAIFRCSPNFALSGQVMDSLISRGTTDAGREARMMIRAGPRNTSSRRRECSRISDTHWRIDSIETRLTQSGRRAKKVPIRGIRGRTSFLPLVRNRCTMSPAPPLYESAPFSSLASAPGQHEQMSSHRTIDDDGAEFSRRETRTSEYSVETLGGFWGDSEANRLDYSTRLGDSEMSRGNSSTRSSDNGDLAYYGALAKKEASEKAEKKRLKAMGTPKAEIDSLGISFFPARTRTTWC